MNGRKYLQIIYLIRGSYSKCMKKSHNTITKQKQNPIKKWAGDDPNKHFSKEDE